jgi:hypothetical protein
MRGIILAVLLIALAACNGTGARVGCAPAEGGIGGTGAPAECRD